MRVAHIQQETAKAFGVPVSIMAGRGRLGKHCEARNAAMWLSWQLLKCGTSHIGREFMRDPATALSGIQRAGDLMERRAEYRATVMSLRRQLGNKRVRELTIEAEGVVHDVIDELMPAFVDSVIEGVMRRMRK